MRLNVDTISVEIDVEKKRQYTFLILSKNNFEFLLSHNFDKYDSKEVVNKNIYAFLFN